jgi:hypothetical protein
LVCVLVSGREESFLVRPLKKEPPIIFCAIHRQQQHGSGFRNASQLFQPAKLVVFIQVRKH